MNIKDFKNYNIVVKLIAINIAVFLLLNLIQVFVYLTIDASDFMREGAVLVKMNKVLAFVSVPATLKALLFKFWTPLTYMFVHLSFWHILGNMLWLYFLGMMLIRYLKDTDFLALYIVGGLAGALMYILAFNIFPIFSDTKIFSILLGASASVTAIVVAMATLKPNEEVYLFGLLRIKLVYIAIFMVIYDVFLLQGDNAGGNFAHIGGAIYGFFYGREFKKGNNITAGFANLIGRILGIEYAKRKKRRNFKVVKNTLHTKDDYQYNQTVTEINTEINKILAKISKVGYNKLSKKEKDFLTKHGKNYK